MTTHAVHRAFRLSAGDLLCIVNGCGMDVSVQHGSFIATQECDLDDTLVTAQAPFRLSRQGKTILAAHCDAFVVLDGCAASVAVKRYSGSAAALLCCC